MTTPRFSEKLDGLPATLDLLASFDPGPMAASLARGNGREALAIGSGGSVVAAEYFVRCRDTLGLGPTSVATPMQAVTDHRGLGATQVWLFSAGGDNPDVGAAVRAVADRGGSDINLVTRNSDGGAAALVARLGGSVHLVPVADIKDSYLATHSLVAMSTGLLLASALASREPGAGSSILEAVTARLTLSRMAEERARRVAQWAGLRTSDTLIVASDPLLRPVASLLDTSLWEAALCPVQSTDFRNLAHGRHAWLHHRMDQSALLALTGSASRLIWSAIDAVLPAHLRRVQIDYGSGGRLANLFGLIDGLAEIEAIGDTLGIDPGKPGIGDFGRAMYDDRSLETLARDLPARVRHKRAAIAKADSAPPDEPSLFSIGEDRLRVLAQADIGGAVFDYDGTIVATDKRYELPDQAIVDELVRLHRLGLKIGIATGRGGSAGKDLRKVLPPDMLGSVDIGYYNGGYVRTADVDIKREPPATDAAIAATAAWLKEQDDLFLDKDFKTGPVQVCIDMHRLRHPYRFELDMSACPQVASGAVRLSASGHSFDIIRSSSSKTLVVEAVQMAVGPTKAVLCFGDSGASCGNDHALLAHPHGISIGEVCSAPNGCWSLFGGTVIGPQALLRVLSALVRSETGGIRLDIAALALDS